MKSPSIGRLALLALAACGATAPAPPQTTPQRGIDGPITTAEWKELCEAQAERARKCPGALPELVEECTARAACFGALVRPDVVRALAKCQAQRDCSACTIERATASLPPTPSGTALDEACAMRQTVCPALDCAALLRPVRAFDVATTAPLVACMRFERSCLDAAACVLEKMAPVIAQGSACNPSSLTGDAPAEGPGEAPPARPR